VIHAFRAEWAKLLRRGALLGGAGILVALSMLAVLLVFSAAKTTPPADAAANRPGGITISQLEGADGLVQALGFASLLMGAVSMVFFALNASNEYAHGTLKLVLSREPRRLVVLAGKFLALCLFLTLSVLLAFAGLTLVASTVASARGMDTSAWWTSTGIGDTMAGLGRLVVACIVRGVIGFTLGLLFRSAAPAIGIGLAYTIIAENLILLAWSDGRNWLPGQVLTAFTQGGTATLSLAAAAGLVALYAIALLAVAGATFHRRDVAG
jgi:ABC-2 type transport system permease protein